MKSKCNNIWLLKQCVHNKWDVRLNIILYFFQEGGDELDLENMDEE